MFKNKVMLGSAQWGSKYGITNTYGQTSLNEMGRIISFASENDCNAIDTANLYGASEKNLGNFDLSSFDVTTKTIQIDSLKIEDKDIAYMTNEFFKSL